MKNGDSLSRDFNAKVISKWMKGVIWKRPYLSVELIDVVPKHCDLLVRMAFWNAVEKGTDIMVKMELCKDDGLWYPA